jgi:sigma-B regulation protein RsbU (phosphoserine phosphatase)
MNSSEEEFGNDRLIDILFKNKNESAEKIIEIILNEVENFAGNVAPMDDKTIVVIKREA